MPGRVILAVAMLTMLIGALVTAPLGAGDDALVVDLLPQRIEVDSSFTGSTVILFGVKTVPGDIIVTLRGPEAPVVVRRKRRVAGIWVNRDSVAFRDVPQYYALAASRPIEEIMASDALDRNQIGTGHILLNTIWTHTSGEIAPFRDAVHRARKREYLYASEIGEIVIIDDSLFRATLTLPANVPTGEYVAETILVGGGEVLNRRESRLTVEKSGMSAEIFNFAKGQGALYGLIAIAAALVAGWAGGVAFRKN
ncbi:MAG: TIGR02186 family protein [Alphaproteobacteria bacterium]|nr:TIGR02186 family protein [Alphaproteobacteria bacterium]